MDEILVSSFKLKLLCRIFLFILFHKVVVTFASVADEILSVTI